MLTATSSLSITRRITLATHDVAIVIATIPLALWLRVGAGEFHSYRPTLEYGIPLFTVLTIMCFLYFCSHRGLWRFTSVADLARIFEASAASVLAFVLLMSAFDVPKPLPATVAPIQLLCLVVLLTGSRVFRRLVYDKVQDHRAVHAARRDRPISVLLVGQLRDAELAIRACQKYVSDTPYRIVGIVELDEACVGREVLGVPILGRFSRLPEILVQHQPQRIVLTSPLYGQALTDLLNLARQANAPLCRMPKPTEFRAGSEAGDFFDMRPINIEDLLCRPPVCLDERAITGLIEGRRVLVTGAGGSIGSELSRQIAQRGPAHLILLDFCEYNLYAIDMEVGTSFAQLPRTAVLADIRDGKRLERLFMQHRPELVFHAAALKHVPMVEQNVVQGVLTNVFGTRNVADAARRCGARAFVQISTDKAVSPTNVMGATKRLAEFYCQALDLAATSPQVGSRATIFKTVRFGNVIGSSGSVVPLFQQQLRRGGPITVTHPDITRYFMTIREASGLVLQALADGMRQEHHRGEIYVLDMGSAIKIIDVAQQMIRLAGLQDVPIEIIGLRPGEKLYEELFDSREEQAPSGLPGVLMARSKPMCMATLEVVLDKLQSACHAGDEAATFRVLARYVPGYAPPAPVSPPEQAARVGSIAPAEAIAV